MTSSPLCAPCDDRLHERADGLRLSEPAVFDAVELFRSGLEEQGVDGETALRRALDALGR